MSKLTTRYYAVPDPDTGDMTFWYLNKKGEIAAWPRKPKARYGPTLWASLKREPGTHDYLVPEGLSGSERNAWIKNFYQTVSWPWHAAIRAEIERDPEAAMARFAAIGYRCCICGKTLADEESRLSAIGPECRKGLPESFVVMLRRKVSQIEGIKHQEGTRS